MNHFLNQAISSLTTGSCVLLIDDVAEEKSGFIVQMAQHASTESISFMANEARGIIYAALPDALAKKFELPPMVSSADTNALQCTISIEARKGVSTGISASDRAITLRALASTSDPKADLVMPGHIFPVCAKKGGVLASSSPVEAAVDLLQLGQVTSPIATLCQCLGESGELATEQELRNLANKHSLCPIFITDIIKTRLTQERIVERVAESVIPTAYAGSFKTICYRSTIDNSEHLVLIRGDIDQNTSQDQSPVLVRVHAENNIDDILGQSHIQKRQQIMGALQDIDKADRGVFIYVRHPRRSELRRYVEDSSASATTKKPPLAIRELGIGSQILVDLGVRRLEVLTNSPRSYTALSAFGLNVTGCKPFSLYQ